MGFKPESSTDDVVSLLRQLLVTASDFKGDHLHLSTNDVEKAFDQMRHKDQVEAVKRRGGTSEEALAIARELGSTR